MTVWSVALRLQSGTRSCRELTALVDCEPTSSTEKETPVSSRNQTGPLRTVSTCSFDSGITDSDLEPHVTALAGPLARLTAGVPDDVSRDLFVGANGRHNGWLFELGPESMRLLADAGCGLMLDVYCDDPADLREEAEPADAEGSVPP